MVELFDATVTGLVTNKHEFTVLYYERCLSGNSSPKPQMASFPLGRNHCRYEKAFGPSRSLVEAILAKHTVGIEQ